MRIYEELFIVRADTPEEELDPLIEQLKGVITSAGGSIEKVDKWGVRKFAYRVAKLNEGQYILIVFNAKAETVKELERRLRVSDMVLKFLTVRIDEKLKLFEKKRKKREKRAARKPAPQPQAASSAAYLPGEPHASVPGAPAPAMPAAPAPPAPPAPAAAVSDPAPKEGAPAETPAS
jgi:small subunit ribosomal protein S6